MAETDRPDATTEEQQVEEEKSLAKKGRRRIIIEDNECQRIVDSEESEASRW